MRSGVTFDRAFIYGKLGAVWGKFDYSSDFSAPFGTTTVRGDAIFTGVLIGVGFEYALTDNWTTKFEYNYIDYGAKTSARWAEHLDAPSEPVRVELTAPSGEQWGWGDPDAANVVRGDEPVRLVVLEERPVQQVHPDDPERLLLRKRLDIEHPHVHDDLARLVVRLCLELHAHPAVALVAAPVAARHDRIGKREEAVLVTTLIAEPVDVELEFLVQHALEPRGRHVPVRLAVDSVANGHVIGGDRLRDGAGRAAHAEEPAHHLLAGPDLGERPVPARIEVDAQGLLMCVGLMSAGDELGHPSPCLLIWPVATAQAEGPARPSNAGIVLLSPRPPPATLARAIRPSPGGYGGPLSCFRNRGGGSAVDAIIGLRHT